MSKLKNYLRKGWQNYINTRIQELKEQGLLK